MAHEQTSIRTADGDCPTHVLTPDGAGPWPAVIVYMDAAGIRPAMIGVAARLAANGYVALLPDMFYRHGPYGPLDAKTLFAGDFMAVIGPLMATTSNLKAAADSAAFLTYLDTRDDIDGKGVGTVGFCMGGGMALTVAGSFPDQVAAAVSFHGGNLATDDPESPHLLAPKIKAEVYVAGADQDSHYPPEMEARLDRTLTDAGVTHRCEIYPGALHGWMKPDFPVYDEAAAERGWTAMLDLFGRTLK